MTEATTDTAVELPDTLAMARRQSWAQALIRRAEKPLPRYGSREWLALPEGHPAKIAGCVLAAECWARESDDLEQRLRTELEDRRRSTKALDDAEYAARAAEHAERWRRQNAVTTPEPWKDQPVPPRGLYEVGAEQRRRWSE